MPTHDPFNISSTALLGNATSFRLRVPQYNDGAQLRVDEFAGKPIKSLAERLAKPGFPKDLDELKKYLEKDLATIADDLSIRTPAKTAVALEAFMALDKKTSLLTEVRELLGKRGLNFNQTALLNQRPIFNYLFAYAVYHQGFTDGPAIARYMSDTKGEGGVRRAYDYIVKEAIKDYVDVKKIQVGTKKDLLNSIKTILDESMFSFSSGVFETELRKPIETFAFDNDTITLITKTVDKLKLVLEADEKSYLVSYFKRSNVPFTATTADYLIPFALVQYRNANLNALSPDTTTPGRVDFSVTYHTESQESLSINKDNVLCAAQLFYVMSMGDELGVFEAMDQFINQYLVPGEVDIKSKQLSQDLQNYALNDEFPDLVTGRMLKRTHASERRMFYRQVFNFGNAEMMEGMITNPDFESLWNALMIETVKYIEKIESSERPESYVSRQYIAQAIEDVQYNLSTQASGMVKLLTPIMYKELDFIMERVFKSPEIVSQLALHNTGSSWKVVERLLKSRYQSSVSVSALRNKAIYGHQILQAIAEYTPVMINQDQKFIEFVGVVEAFIITGEQLENQRSSLFDTNHTNGISNPVNGAVNHTNGMDGAPNNMWDF